MAFITVINFTFTRTRQLLLLFLALPLTISSFFQVWYSLKILPLDPTSSSFSSFTVENDSLTTSITWTAKYDSPTIEGRRGVNSSNQVKLGFLRPEKSTQQEHRQQDEILLPSVASGAVRASLRQDGPDYAHCFYRTYQENEPDRHSGLPLLAEVFASPDGDYVFLAVESHVGCHNDDSRAHYFYSDPPHRRLNRNVTFDCIFEHDGSRTTSLPVHRMAKIRMHYALIACPVPSHLQPLLPESGSHVTKSFLTLQSKLDLVTGTRFSKNESTPSHQLRHLPICSHAWPSEKEALHHQSVLRVAGDAPTTNEKKKKYKISLMTRIALSYKRGGSGETSNEPLSVTHMEFVTWMEYHAALGVEHFYIYDDSSLEQTTLYQWCEPYIQQGLVTYVHYPRPDNICSDGRHVYSAQFISTNAALRRYEAETEWMGHWDVDEYLVIGEGGGSALEQHNDQLRSSTLRDFIEYHGNGVTQGENKHGSSSSISSSHNNNKNNNKKKKKKKKKNNNSFKNGLPDDLSFRRNIVFGVCKNNDDATNNRHGDSQTTARTFTAPTSNKDNNTMPFVQKQCFVQKGDAPKGIYRTSTVLFFKVHTSEIRMDQQSTNVKHIDFKLGYMAHFRKGLAAGSHFPRSSQTFQPWVELLQDRIQRKLRLTSE
ncbi:hypothetical protein ACA910_012390 [Epithemia clementina (nom. ined.)]